MYYEINVSLNGKHFFATSDRSIRDEQRLKVVLPEIIARFPRGQGYIVNVTRYELNGYPVDMALV